MKIPLTDVIRLRHINFLMDELHDSLNDIYESLVDKDIEQLNIELKNLISKLKEISDDEELD